MKVLSLALVLGAMSVATASAQSVKICDDEAGWPPYVYNPIENGKADKSKIEGAAIDFVNRIFEEVGLEHSTELLPWKRCLAEVENFGDRGNFEMFQNGSYNAERTKIYYISESIYETGRGLFYSTKKFPDGLDVNSVEDAKKYKVCGVHGYNYIDWNLADNQIETSAKSTEQALKKVAAGRCDVVPSAIEPIYGSAAIGKPIVPNGVKPHVVEFLDKTTFHIYIAKTSPRGEELRDKINAAIKKLRADGTHKKIFSQYLNF